MNPDELYPQDLPADAIPLNLGGSSSGPEQPIRLQASLPQDGETIRPEVVATEPEAKEFETNAAVDEAVVDEASLDKAAVEKAAVEKAAVEKSAVEKSAVEKSAVDEVAVTAASAPTPDLAAIALDDLTAQKQALQRDIESLNQELKAKRGALESVFEESLADLRDRQHTLKLNIEQLERRRDTIRREMRDNFAGVSQDLALRVQGFKDYLVGSLQDLVNIAEQMELAPAAPVQAQASELDTPAAEKQALPLPKFAQQDAQAQEQEIRDILDRYRTAPDYYGPPWQLRRTFEPVHVERVSQWFFQRGGRGAVRSMGSRLQNILIASAAISVLNELYGDRVCALVLANSPERLGDWRRGLQECLGVSRADFGPQEGIMLCESPEPLVQRAERMLKAGDMPLVILDESEALVDISLLQFPLMLAFSPDPMRPLEPAFDGGARDRSKEKGFLDRVTDSLDRMTDKLIGEDRYDDDYGREGRGGYGQPYGQSYSQSGSQSGYGADPYAQDRYNQDRYNQDRYNQDRYSQDRYSQDRYAPVENSSRQRNASWFDQATRNDRERQNRDDETVQAYSDSQGYADQGYRDPTYNAQNYNAQNYNNQNYSDQSYDSQSDNSQSDNSQSYGTSGYDDRAYDDASYAQSDYTPSDYTPSGYAQSGYGRRSNNPSDNRSNRSDNRSSRIERPYEGGREEDDDWI